MGAHLWSLKSNFQNSLTHPPPTNIMKASNPKNKYTHTSLNSVKKKAHKGMETGKRNSRRGQKFQLKNKAKFEGKAYVNGKDIPLLGAGSSGKGSVGKGALRRQPKTKTSIRKVSKRGMSVPEKTPKGTAPNTKEQLQMIEN